MEISWPTFIVRALPTSSGSFTKFYEATTCRMRESEASLLRCSKFISENIQCVANSGTFGIMITMHAIYYITEMKLNYHVPHYMLTFSQLAHHYNTANQQSNTSQNLIFLFFFFYFRRLSHCLYCGTTPSQTASELYHEPTGILFFCFCFPPPGRADSSFRNFTVLAEPDETTDSSAIAKSWPDILQFDSRWSNEKKCWDLLQWRSVYHVWAHWKKKKLVFLREDDKRICSERVLISYKARVEFKNEGAWRAGGFFFF